MVTICILAISATLLTNYLILKKSFSPIRASTSVTILLVSLMMSVFDDSFTSTHSGTVLGGTFIGMTDPKRLTGKLLLIACVCFSMGYRYLVPMNKGFGGALGFIAFMSCTSTSVLANLWRK